MSLPLTLYTKTDCELCEPFKTIVLDVVAAKLLKDKIEVSVIDIDTDPAAFERYHDKIPVLEINGRLAFKYRITKQALLLALTRQLSGF